MLRRLLTLLLLLLPCALCRADCDCDPYPWIDNTYYLHFDAEGQGISSTGVFTIFGMRSAFFVDNITGEFNGTPIARLLPVGTLIPDCTDNCGLDFIKNDNIIEVAPPQDQFVNPSIDFGFMSYGGVAFQLTDGQEYFFAGLSGGFNVLLSADDTDLGRIITTGTYVDAPAATPEPGSLFLLLTGLLLLPLLARSLPAHFLAEKTTHALSSTDC